jgi:hypothetical protein
MEDPCLLWAGLPLAPPAGEPLPPPRRAPASNTASPYLLRAEPLPPRRAPASSARSPFLLRAEPLPPPRRAPASCGASLCRLLPGEPLPPLAGEPLPLAGELGDRERREKGAAASWATEKGGRRERRLGEGRRERRLGEGRREKGAAAGPGRREKGGRRALVLAFGPARERSCQL